MLSCIRSKVRIFIGTDKIQTLVRSTDRYSFGAQSEKHEHHSLCSVTVFVRDFQISDLRKNIASNSFIKDHQTFINRKTYNERRRGSRHIRNPWLRDRPWHILGSSPRDVDSGRVHWD